MIVNICSSVCCYTVRFYRMVCITMSTSNYYLLCVLLYACVLNAQVNIHDVNEKNVRDIRKPFRMAKINLLWDKAAQQENLSAMKLLALLSDLKVQDKQELTLKKLKAEGGDKEGQMEAQLRKSLRDIMDKYRLGRSDESVDISKPSINYLFKDKKLNKLWEKAERSGFTQEELKALKEEFQHHQDKVDQYYELLTSNKVAHTANNDLKDDTHKFDHFESMEESNEASFPHASAVNKLREKHRSLKDGYDRLHKVVSNGPDTKEFMEPKVAGLWKLALQADFSQAELESLHTELKHYENRLLKVRYLTSELLRLRKTGGNDDGHPDKDLHLASKLNEASESEGERLLQERVAKQRRTVDKLHEHLEARILQRHSEL